MVSLLLFLSAIHAEPLSRYFKDIDTNIDGSVSLEELQHSLSLTYPHGFLGGGPFKALSSSHAPLLQIHVRTFNALDSDVDGLLNPVQLKQFVQWRLYNEIGMEAKSMDFLWRSALPSIQHFTENCDPWNRCFRNSILGIYNTNNRSCHRMITDADFSTYGSWDICPVQHRSPSGCGDFIDDPRKLECAAKRMLPLGDDREQIDQP